MLESKTRELELQPLELDPTEGRREDGSKWHALVATWLGEAFDAMDASLYFVALVPAMAELLGTRDDTIIGQHGSFVLAIFMVGWFIGALIFGLLADRIGRRKTMLITILIYSFATGLCAICQDWIQLGLCRFVVGCGIGGEICLGTVVIAEFWKGRSRLWATCVLESSFNVGLLFSAGINALLGACGWRFLFVAGILPAVATLYIRSRLKESDSFEKVSGHRKALKQINDSRKSTSQQVLLRSPLVQLMDPAFRGKLLTLVFLSSSAIVGFWACVAWLPAWVNQLTGTLAIDERSLATTIFSAGGLLGCFATPLALDRAGRAGVMKMSFGGALIVSILMFLTVKTYGIPLLIWSFVLGILTNMQFAALQIYIPEVFPTSMLATAAGICFGAGRIFAAALAIYGAHLIAVYGGSYAYAAATLSTVYIIGALAGFFVEETNGTPAGTANLE